MREVIAAVEAVTGRKVPVVFGDRRAGDPAVLFAASDRIKSEAGWSPRYADIGEIVRTAFVWREGHKGGYLDR